MATLDQGLDLGGGSAQNLGDLVVEALGVKVEDAGEGVGQERVMSGGTGMHNSRCLFHRRDSGRPGAIRCLLPRGDGGRRGDLRGDTLRKRHLDADFDRIVVRVGGVVGHEQVGVDQDGEGANVVEESGGSRDGKEKVWASPYLQCVQENDAPNRGFTGKGGLQIEKLSLSIHETVGVDALEVGRRAKQGGREKGEVTGLGAETQGAETQGGLGLEGNASGGEDIGVLRHGREGN